MKTNVGALLVAGLFLCSSIAIAAPKALSSAELDGVAAGFGNWAPPSTNNTPQNIPFMVTEDVAVAELGGLAIDGNENEYKEAFASEDAIAVIGNDNETIDGSNFVDGDGDCEIAIAGEMNEAISIEQDADFALVAGENLSLNATYNEIGSVDESAVVLGTNNHVTVTQDDTYIDGFIGNGGYGVIAKEACVVDSFNTSIVETYVTVTIEDSFNCISNTLDISGQNNMTALVNANTLGDQYIGVAVNVTNAAATSSAPGPSAPVVATAQTAVTQVVVNGSCFFGIGVIDLFPGNGG
jgi:hypothetical protein